MNNTILIRKLKILLLSCLVVGSISAQGWENIMPEANGYTRADLITETTDGNFVTAGFASGILSQDFGSYARKFTGGGEVIWTKKLPDEDFFSIFPLENGGTLLHGSNSFNFGTRPKFTFLDVDGNVTNQFVYPFVSEVDEIYFTDIIPQADGTFIYYRNVTNGTADNAIGFMDQNGVITNEIFGSFGEDMAQLANGNLMFFTYGTALTFVSEYDLSGNFQNTMTLPISIGFSTVNGFYHHYSWND